MSGPARFGRLARAYRWMEYLSFGPYLQECRLLRLEEMESCRRALVYGDGDGRFLAELARRAPQIQVAAVDASGEMLSGAAQRLPSSTPVRLVQADALAYEAAALPEAPFDLIVSHFFLDCFNEEELTVLLTRVNRAAAQDAVWVVSDFAVPQRPIVRQAGRLVVSGLYLAFGLLTGLRTRRLPDHGRAMREGGWRLEDRRTLLLGLLVSERWRFFPVGVERPTETSCGFSLRKSHTETLFSTHSIREKALALGYCSVRMIDDSGSNAVTSMASSHQA